MCFTVATHYLKNYFTMSDDAGEKKWWDLHQQFFDETRFFRELIKYARKTTEKNVKTENKKNVRSLILIKSLKTNLRIEEQNLS